MKTVNSLYWFVLTSHFEGNEWMVEAIPCRIILRYRRVKKIAIHYDRKVSFCLSVIVAA